MKRFIILVILTTTIFFTHKYFGFEITVLGMLVYIIGEIVYSAVKRYEITVKNPKK